jgi:hypothetical protein
MSEILQDFPGITMEDVLACVAFCKPAALRWRRGCWWRSKLDLIYYLNFAHIKVKPRFSFSFWNQFGGGFSLTVQNRGIKKQSVLVNNWDAFVFLGMSEDRRVGNTKISGVVG